MFWFFVFRTARTKGLQLKIGENSRPVSSKKERIKNFMHGTRGKGREIKRRKNIARTTHELRSRHALPWKTMTTWCFQWLRRRPCFEGYMIPHARPRTWWHFLHASACIAHAHLFFVFLFNLVSASIRALQLCLEIEFIPHDPALFF